MRMPRPGRPSDTRSTQIKQTILSLVNQEGRTFTEITQAARVQGISKPCVWRHLGQFVKMGILRHRGRLYQINPLYDQSVTIGKLSLRYLDDPKKTEPAQVRIHFKELYERIAKSQPRNWAERPPKEVDLTKKDDLRETFFLAALFVLVHYLSILEGVAKIDDAKAAEEFVDLMMSTEINPMLRGFARRTWLDRKRISWENLDGLRLPLLVRHAASKD